MQRTFNMISILADDALFEHRGPHITARGQQIFLHFLREKNFTDDTLFIIIIILI